MLLWDIIQDPFIAGKKVSIDFCGLGIININVTVHARKKVEVGTRVFQELFVLSEGLGNVHVQE